MDQRLHRPKPGRYHAGLILGLTLESLVERGAYDEADFCRRMDQFFTRLDGLPMGGPGGYTSQSIRDGWHKRVEQGRPWGQVGGPADTTEAIERSLAIAVRYAGQPGALARAVAGNTRLTQTDQSDTGSA